ncbi:BTAD domain-containing putative transcriptional regulator [Streptomyces sp. WI04-05B]|uniref:BTAD domain-containing putative transcriptional regulator n=1 Tax=Streptomyces TaxID=1883 RepID=UPI0029BC8F3F|nr:MULTISPECIES: BTAD domain-containing putative transcriptional regulator [unclassified Streptomyces]MDX2545367.1 BTAD domain-containing putative transcriptional regulator [Streptomyces sp. WI04-05B]MDX2588138.1 BTAD domain-containing putative transcriptional regulator [Streptomyces sp. WI04-05A]
MKERLRFSLLGPVRAWRGKDEIALGPPQQRALLAVLLLAEGSQVSVDRLVDAVWGTEAPASARGILRTYIHRLRKVLEPAGDPASSVIRAAGDGYQLTAPGELDLSVFRELLAQAERLRGAGDARGAAKCLGDALALWRGTALAGVRGEYADSQRQRLDELRLSAEAARRAVELELGGHEQAVSELTGLVAEHPLDERFRELLMLALYRSGRQAAALATYREVQTLLASELGVDPGPTLQATYRRVLQADVGLLAPPVQAEPASDPAVPAQLPASVPVKPAPEPAPVPASVPVVPVQLPSGPVVLVGRDASGEGTGGPDTRTRRLRWMVLAGSGLAIALLASSPILVAGSDSDKDGSAAGSSTERPSTTGPSASKPGSGVAIQSHASDRCVDGGTFGDTALRIQDCSSSDRQYWQIVSEDRLVRISGKCLDIAGGSTDNGAAVRLADCNGGGSQRFRLNPAHDLVNLQAHKCVEATDPRGSNGTPLRLWSCTGAQNQKWTAVS